MRNVAIFYMSQDKGRYFISSPPWSMWYCHSKLHVWTWTRGAVNYSLMVTGKSPQTPINQTPTTYLEHFMSEKILHLLSCRDCKHDCKPLLPEYEKYAFVLCWPFLVMSAIHKNDTKSLISRENWMETYLTSGVNMCCASYWNSTIGCKNIYWQDDSQVCLLHTSTYAGEYLEMNKIWTYLNILICCLI